MNASAIIPVPTSGLGPVVGVANLVGGKTVQLAGTFRGSYDLLGSQDNVNFVPVLSFSAGGPEGIKQTFSAALSSVRLRSVGTEQISPIACEVTALLGAGENHFLTVASLVPGFSGLTPAVDTWALFPPTGLEEDMCYLCRGGFRGSVTVLGSMDGAGYNPIGAFQVGVVPEGAPAVLELTPLLTPDKVRYVRLAVSGLITSQTVVTLGGRVPAAAPSTVPTLAQSYSAGAAAADQTFALLDSKGGGLVVDGTSPGFTGAYAVDVLGHQHVSLDVSVGVATATARLHPAAGTASAGTAPLKVPPGVVLTVPEPGAVEADASHVYWTSGAGVRLQLDNATPVTPTLAQSYAAGVVASDQTLVLLDVEGGGLVVDGTSPSFTGVYALAALGRAQVTLALDVGNAVAGATTSLAVLGNRTIAAPAAGSTWKAIDFQSSTLTLAAGGTSPSSLFVAYLAAPVVTETLGGPAYAIATAATLAIAGSPAPSSVGGQSPTVANSYALWSQSGTNRFDGLVGCGVASPRAIVDVADTVPFSNRLLFSGTDSLGVSSTDGVAIRLLYNLAGNRVLCIADSALPIDGTSRSIVIGEDSINGSSTDGNSFTPLFLQLDNVLGLGTSSFVNGNRIVMSGSSGVLSAAGATWDGVIVNPSLLIVSGTTSPITELSLFKVSAPQVSASDGPVVVTDFYTQLIKAATFAGTGPASATRSWSLGVDGNVRLNGGQAVRATDVNAAGPYTVLETDYALQIRYTPTGPISINLPAISGMAAGTPRVLLSIDSGYNCAANNITLVRSGADKINNVSGNYVQNVNGSAIWLLANTTTLNWEIV